MNKQNSLMNLSTKKIRLIIWIISIGIPLLVMSLFQIKINYSLPFLPYVNAVINTITLLCIILAFLFIKKGNKKLHRKLMTTALILSILFLLFYLLYHAGSDEAKFGGEGNIRYLYFSLLISHILLSAIIVPMVLISYLRAKLEQFDKHKRIARISFFIWVYVLISGIAVFWMIQPYYQ